MRLAWSDERSVRFAGEHYRLDGYHPGPPPVHPIGIWLGAYKPRMLRLTGEKADGWVPSLREDYTPEKLGELGKVVSEAAAAAGRDPADVRRLWNVMGASADPARLTDELVGWARSHGVDTFVIWPEGEDQEAQVERLAAEVAPAVREAMGAT
jgi:alkanesulfonate monooxygenase SsuD/methylene tetrahydromethanopterin reductase-like flavin-dependent oxidoreductase (luciferase family)